MATKTVGESNNMRMCMLPMMMPVGGVVNNMSLKATRRLADCEDRIDAVRLVYVLSLRDQT